LAFAVNNLNIDEGRVRVDFLMRNSKDNPFFVTYYGNMKQDLPIHVKSCNVFTAKWLQSSFEATLTIYKKPGIAYRTIFPGDGIVISMGHGYLKSVFAGKVETVETNITPTGSEDVIIAKSRGHFLTKQLMTISAPRDTPWQEVLDEVFEFISRINPRLGKNRGEETIEQEYSRNTTLITSDLPPEMISEAESYYDQEENLFVSRSDTIPIYERAIATGEAALKVIREEEQRREINVTASDYFRAEQNVEDRSGVVVFSETVPIETRLVRDIVVRGEIPSDKEVGAYGFYMSDTIANILDAIMNEIKKRYRILYEWFIDLSGRIVIQQRKIAPEFGRNARIFYSYGEDCFGKLRSSLEGVINMFVCRGTYVGTSDPIEPEWEAYAEGRTSPNFQNPADISLADYSNLIRRTTFGDVIEMHVTRPETQRRAFRPTAIAINKTSAFEGLNPVVLDLPDVTTEKELLDRALQLLLIYSRPKQQGYLIGIGKPIYDIWNTILVLGDVRRESPVTQSRQASGLFLRVKEKFKTIFQRVVDSSGLVESGLGRFSAVWAKRSVIAEAIKVIREGTTGIEEGASGLSTMFNIDPEQGQVFFERLLLQLSDTLDEDGQALLIGSEHYTEEGRAICYLGGARHTFDSGGYETKLVFYKARRPRNFSLENFFMEEQITINEDLLRAFGGDPNALDPRTRGDIARAGYMFRWQVARVEGLVKNQGANEVEGLGAEWYYKLSLGRAATQLIGLPMVPHAGRFTGQSRGEGVFGGPIGYHKAGARVWINRLGQYALVWGSAKLERVPEIYSDPHNDLINNDNTPADAEIWNVSNESGFRFFMNKKKIRVESDNFISYMELEKITDGEYEGTIQISDTVKITLDKDEINIEVPNGKFVNIGGPGAVELARGGHTHEFDHTHVCAGAGNPSSSPTPTDTDETDDTGKTDKCRGE